jgi:rubredoxin
MPTIIAPRSTSSRLPPNPDQSFQKKGNDMKTYQCIVCGFIYDEAIGLPEDGIAPGTKWDDIPANWECPDCGVAKADFEMVEI